MPPWSIDIAIVNYRGTDDVLRALALLGAWPHGRIWLIDNSAHDKDIAGQSSALAHACAANPAVTRLIPEGNIGFGRACNMAFQNSVSEYFLLLNPDARISADGIVAMAGVLSANQQYGALSPKIFWNESRSFLLPEGFAQTPWQHFVNTLQPHAGRLAKLLGKRDVWQGMRRMALDSPFDVKFLVGAVMMVRRVAADAAGGLFDPDYFMFFEDADLSMRLRQAGYRLAIAPNISAVHEYRHKAFKAEMMRDSLHIYFRKRFPGYYYCSGKLDGLSALSRSISPEAWFAVIAPSLTSAAEFAARTEGAAVVAFSPSLLMRPCIFRPSLTDAHCFDDAEWSMLEPGAYVALLATRNHSPMKWVYFEKK